MFSTRGCRIVMENPWSLVKDPSGHLQEKEKVKAALLKEVPKEKDKDADKDDAKKDLKILGPIT